MSLSPFDLTGTPFLWLYSVLLIAAIVAGFIIPIWLRPQGRAGQITSSEELAYLAGGPIRFAETIVIRLLVDGALSVASSKQFHIMSPQAGRTTAEGSVLGLSGPVRWKAIESRLEPHAAPIERQLVESGLLMDEGHTIQMRFWQTLPYLALLLFGAIKWMAGTGGDRPVEYLATFLVMTAVMAFARCRAVDRRTRSGLEALADARASADRLARAPMASETERAVALFGTGVLIGSSWELFHQLRTSKSSSEAETSGNGSGCGGCGGCGGD